MAPRAWLSSGWRTLLGTLLLVSVTLAAEKVQHPNLFRIGSAGAGGIYFPVASIIAVAISGFSECTDRQDCGVPNLLAIAQLSNGSVSNVRDLRNGNLEAGLVQADVAYTAYYGKGVFAREGPYLNLRAIANLYPENVHLVVAADSNIQTVADLRSKRVSLDEPGSGTLETARLILDVFGLQEHNLKAIYLKQQLAAQALRQGQLDAFFLVAGYPATAVAELAKQHEIRLVSIGGSRMQALYASRPYFFATEIPAEVYRGVPRTASVAVGAQLLVGARLDEQLVYRITRILWAEPTRTTFIQGHPIGRAIRLQQALKGITIPLHPGAARYYQEAGLLETQPVKP